MRALSSRLLVGALALIPAVASAQVTPAAAYTPPDDTQSIRVGSVIFYDYTYTHRPQATDAAGNLYSPQAFNVGRAYINVTGNVSHIISFRVTPDITREAGTGSTLIGSLTVRLKYGYAQFSLDDWTGSWKQTWVRGGIQQTPFIDGQESVYRYRFQGTVFAERDGGQTSADAGVSFHTNIPGNYGDVHFGYYNGDGYSRAEANDQKSFQVRATIRPLPGGSFLVKGIRGTVFFNNDQPVKGGTRDRFIGSVWYEHRHLNAGFDYLTGAEQTLPTNPKSDVDGYSFFVTPFFKEKGNGVEALLRYDSYRPNADLSARRNRFIGGVSYWFPHPGGNATAALLLDYEQVTFARFTTAQAKQQRIALHGLINF